MKKGLIPTILLCLCLFQIGMLPAPAESSCPFLVTGGEEGTDYTYSDSELKIHTTSPLTISMDSSAEVADNKIRVSTENGPADITLFNVQTNVDDWYNIHIMGGNPCILRLKGNNQLTNTTNSAGACIRLYDVGTSLTITSNEQGTLSLSHTGTNGAILANNNNDLTIQGNAEVDITSKNSSGIANCGLTTINENAVVKIASEATDHSAIISGNSTGHGITIDGNAEVTITSGKYGLNNNGKAPTTIGGNAVVKVSGVNYGFNSPYSPITVSGNSNITVSADKFGLYTRDSICIKDNSLVEITISASNRTYGISCTNGFTAQDSAKVTVKGVGAYGLYVSSGSPNPALIQDQAVVELTAENAISGSGFTVSPTSNKFYEVISGEAKDTTTSQYYGEKTDNLKVRAGYFCAQPSDHGYQPILSLSASPKGNLSYGTSVTLTATISGAAASEGNSIKFYDGNSFLGTSVTGEDGTAEWRLTAPDTAFHQFKAVLEASTNHSQAESNTIDVTVVAAVPTIIFCTQNQQGSGENHSVDLVATVTGADGGEIPTGSIEFWNGTTMLGVSSLVDGTTTFTWRQIPIGTHSLKAVYRGSSNYTAAESSVSYNLDKDAQAPLTVGLVSPVTYGDAPFTLTVTGGSGNGAITYTVTGNSIVYDQAVNQFTIVNAGESTITVTKAADEHYNEISTTVKITVSQAIPTISVQPEASRVRRGHLLSTSTLSNGMVTGLDGITVLEGKWDWENDRPMGETGVFEEAAIFTPVDSNYAPIKAETISVTVYRPSSGSSTPSYRPTIEDSGHGTVTVSPSYAEQGEEVTITPKPDTGYQMDEILVTDQNGKKLELKDNGDGTCTFVQPKGKVTIETTFTEAACDGGKDCPSTAYRDVPVSAWYHEAVDYAIENELMKGYSTSAFGPNDTLTRAMMVQILWNLEGQPVVNYAMQYTDVDTDAWYAEAVRWASSEQIVMGYSEAQFGPEDSITREQMAAVLYRYAQYQDYDTPRVVWQSGNTATMTASPPGR